RLTDAVATSPAVLGAVFRILTGIADPVAAAVVLRTTGLGRRFRRRHAGREQPQEQEAKRSDDFPHGVGQRSSTATIGGRLESGLYERGPAGPVDLRSPARSRT